MTPTDTAPTGSSTVRDAVLAAAARLRHDAASSATRARPSCRCSSTSRPTSDYVLGLQESVVVGMADGYATATGNAAFVNLHSAVGVGHAMGAIFTAWKNRTPLVVTAGQQARSILPVRSVPVLGAGDRAAQALRQVELRAGAGRGRAAGDRPRLLRRDAAAARPGAGLDPVRRLGPALRAGRAAPGEPGAALRLWRAGRRSAMRSTPASGRPSSSAPASTAAAPGTRCGRWPSGTVPASSPRRCRRAAASPRTIRSSPASCRRCASGSSPPSPAATWCWCWARRPSPITSKATGRTCRRAPTLVPDHRRSRHRRPRAGRHLGGGQHLRDAVQTLLQRPPPRPRPMPAGRPARPRAEPSQPMSVAYALQTLAELRAPEHVIVEEVAERASGDARLPADAEERHLLHDGQRRPRLRPAGRRRRGAGPARGAGDRPGRRRLGDVLDPGPVERGAAEAAR